MFNLIFVLIAFIFVLKVGRRLKIVFGVIALFVLWLLLFGK